MENIYLILFKNNVHTCISHQCHKSYFCIMNKNLYIFYKRRIRVESYNFATLIIISIATMLILEYIKYLIQLPVEQTGPEYTKSTEDPQSQYPAHWPRVHVVNRGSAVAHFTFHIYNNTP